MYRAGTVKDVYGEMFLGVEEYGTYVPGLQDFEYTQDYMRKKRILNPLLGEGSGPHAFMELTSVSRYPVLTSCDYIVNLNEFRSEYLVLEACDQTYLERLRELNSKICFPQQC